MKENTSAYSLLPVLAIILTLGALFFLLAVLANLNTPNIRLSPEAKSYAIPLLNWFGSLSSILICCTALFLGVWLIISSQSQDSQTKYSLPHGIKEKIIIIYPIIIIILSMFSSIYNLDYSPITYIPSTGQSEPKYYSNIIGITFAYAILKNFGVIVFWLIQTVLFSIILLTCFSKWYLFKQYKGVVFVSFIFSIPFFSYTTANLTLDHVPWIEMVDNGKYPDKGNFQNLLGLWLFNFFQYNFAYSGSILPAHIIFYGCWFCSYWICMLPTGINIISPVFCLLDKIPDTGLKKKIAIHLSNIHLSNIQKLMPVLTRIKGLKLQKNHALSEEKVENIPPQTLQKTKQDIDETKQWVEQITKTEAQKQAMLQPINYVREKHQLRLDKAKETAEIAEREVEKLPTLKPIIKPRKVPHIFKVAQQLQEIFSTTSWKNLVKIDGGKAGCKLKTGLLKYIIPLRIAGNRSADLLYDKRVLEHISDRLTAGFWNKYGHKFDNLSEEEEKQYIIRASTTKSRGQYMLMLDKEQPLRQKFTFIQFNKRINLLGKIKKQGKGNFLLGLDQLGNPIFGNIWECKHQARQGMTQSGKSNAVMMSIVSAMLGNSHKELKFIIVDAAEKQDLSGIFTRTVSKHVHYMADDAEKAVKALDYALKLASRRGKLRKTVKGGCINLIEFNKLAKAQGKPEQPIVVVVIAELAGLLSGNNETTKMLLEMICKLLTQGAADGIFCWLDSTALYKAVSTNLAKIPWNNIQTKISFYNPENTKAFFGQGQSCTINPALLARQGDALLVKDGSESVSMTTLQMPTQEISQLFRITNTQRHELS